MTCRKLAHVINVEIFSFAIWFSLPFSHADHFHLSLFSFSVCFSLSLMVDYRSPGSRTSKKATIGYHDHHYLPSPCESLSGQWDLVWGRK